MLYNSLLHYRFRVPVHSLIVLLRPAADDSKLSERLHYQVRPGKGKMDFGYDVVRLWKWPAQRLLRGGLGTVPLALLGRFPGKKWPVEIAMIRWFSKYWNACRREHPAGEAKLLTAAYVLSGLRVPRIVFRPSLSGESKPCRINALIKASSKMGALTKRAASFSAKAQRFGKPSAAVQARIEGLANLDQLERLTDRILAASSWQELLESV